MKKIFKKSIIIAMSVVLLASILFSVFHFGLDNKKVLSSVSDIINNPDEQQELKVIVIVIDPTLYSITDAERYPDNPGNHPRVSDWFGNKTVETATNDLKTDLEEISHGYLNVNIVEYDYLDEFPKYKTPIALLKNGQYSDRFDEETYVWMSRVSNENYGDHPQMTRTENFKSVDAGRFQFDYDYLINKYDLINKRKNGFFDQVWIMGMDPLSGAETMMVGKNPYYINGAEKSTYVNSDGQEVSVDCDNFVIGGFSNNSEDKKLHSFGHMMEQIMKRVMGETTAASLPPVVEGEANGIYSHHLYNINSKSAYNNLNDWEKFTLSNYNNKNSNYTSVGSVHFPFYTDQNYGYAYTGQSKTNWREWLNYPNVPGDNFVLDDQTAFLDADINSNLMNDPDPRNQSHDRLWNRFWFSLMPHVAGYSEDGYYYNWWKYWYTLDYATGITNNLSSNIITVEAYNYVPTNYFVNYYSGDKMRIQKVPQGNNVQISNTNVLGFSNGFLYAKSSGTSNFTVKYDGNEYTYTVVVSPSSQTLPSSVTLNKQTMSLNAEGSGTTEKLTATVSPSNADNKTITWTSSNPSVATVDSNGNVTAVGVGTTTITASTINEKKATCTVTVVKPVTSIELNKSSITLETGTNQTLTATVKPNDATDKTVTWTSSNSSVASVSNGVVTAVSAGTATITAKTSNNISATCTVIVNDPVIEVENVTLNKSTMSLNVGGSEKLTATVSPNNATNKTISWSSNKENVATVNSNGKVTGVGAGTAKITARTHNGMEATCNVTVTLVMPTSVSITPNSLDLIVGGSGTFSAVVLPEDATDKSVTWESTNPSVATIDSSGKVTALSVGHTMIKATSASNSLYANAYVHVTDATINPTSVELNKTTLNLTAGDKTTLVATVLPENATNKLVYFTSNNANVATVDTQSGLVTAVGAGTATITAATPFPGVLATCNVTVTGAEVPATSVELNKTSISITKGTTYTLTATVKPNDATNKTVTWTSSDTDVATVSNGVVTGVSVGTATITVKTSNNKTAACNITVTNPTVAVSGISLNKTTLSLEVNSTETLVPTISPSNATNKTVTWTSSDPGVAQVSMNGKITALDEGTTTITATTHNNKVATCLVTVYRNETPTPKSNDSTLSSLVPNVGELNPAFTSGNTNYTMSVDFRTVRSVSFAATTNHPAADSGITECTIPNSTTIQNITCNITVTAEDLTNSTYNIRIDNSAYTGGSETQGNITVNSITNDVNGILDPPFSQDIYNYVMDINFLNYEYINFEVDTERSVIVSGKKCIIPTSSNVESVTCIIDLTKGNQTESYTILVRNTNQLSDVCDLTITSDVYLVDESSRTIKVVGNHDLETIKYNLKSTCGEIRVFHDRIVITNEEASKEYTLERIIVPQTGKAKKPYKLVFIIVLSMLCISFIIAYISRKKKSI